MNHFLKISDVSAGEFGELIKLSESLKADNKNNREHHLLKGKSLAMIFAKSSTRTRVSFEVGMYQLGGSALFLNSNDIQLGRGETVSDTANTLSGYIDGIMIRTFEQNDVEDLAKFGSVPVINGLTDLHHPCQALADLFTMYEKFGKLEGLKLAYVGDGNNVANSLMEACALMGVDFAVATPAGCECDADITNKAMQVAKASGAEIIVTDDPQKVCYNADAIYTDTWVSMGQESQKDEKVKLFGGYQVNDALFANAKDNAIFLHCLPAYRGFEMTAEIIDGPRSAVFQQAENRLHVQKAVMAMLMRS